MDFTAEQAAAIFTHDRNLIVTAGAGSGKTRVLVERFMALLDANPDWKLNEVVAITFTEKAAREMRDRVRDALRARIQNAASDAEQARWREHETLLDSARIGTIHSLCSQILRTNPAHVPIDPGFEVLDENEAFLLRIEAVEQTLSDLVQRELPVVELMLHYSVREVRKVLLGFAARSEAETLFATIPDSVDELLQVWEERRVEAAREWVKRVQSDIVLKANINWLLPRHLDTVPPDDRIMLVWQNVLAIADDLQTDDVSELLHTLDRLRDAITLRGSSAKRWGGDSEFADCKAALTNIRDFSKSYLANFPAPLSELDAESARLLGLWQDAVALASENYSALKDERAVLDFDDLEALTVQLLRDRPDAAARYMDEFRHVMVDEFQDTNHRQRDIVYALCGSVPGRLFVVGDPKQSIYAFRGADVSVFDAVRQDITRHMGGVDLPLSASFRSHTTLVETFNALFSGLLTGGAGFEVAYDTPMTAFRASRDFHAVPVQVLVLEQPESENQYYVDDYRRWEAYEIAQRIHAMVENQTPVYDKEMGDYRPFEYGDAAILFRALTHTTLYEDVFKACDLPYVTIAGRGYYDRQEVWDMLNLLRALHNPADDLALASALRSPMFGLSDDALFALRLTKNRLWDALAQSPADFAFPVPADDLPVLDFVRESLHRLAGLAGRVTVEELIDAIVDETAYDAVLTALPDGDRRRGNLDKLMQKARESGRVSLSEFMVYMRDLSGVEPREGEAVIETSGAVKIMSVHKSKGLEFPLVVLANADWTITQRFTSPLVVDSEIGAACFVRTPANEKMEPFAYQQAKELALRRDAAEHKRLLYVAATRAQDYLLVTGRDGKDGSWIKMLTEVIDSTDKQWDLVKKEHLIEPPPIDFTNRGSRGRSGWDMLEEKNAGAAHMPPLVGAVPAVETTRVHHLSVTQLEQLGSIQFYNPEERGRRIFRNSVLHDAPDAIRPIQKQHASYLTSRIVGRMVHRALQVGALERGGDLYEVLRVYAWNEGVTDPHLLSDVVRQAETLLRDFQREGEPDSLRGADLVLREVPFIYRLNGRIIHGIVDALYQYQDQWHVLDYKTAAVRREFAARHAERYMIQLGAYAQAVAARTGQIPVTQLYYLYPGILIDVTQAQWRAALENLDNLVDEALF